MKWVLLIFCLQVRVVSGQPFTAQDYKTDFVYFWETINDNYCYFDKKQTDWQKVKAVYEKRIDTITSLSSFVGLLESALRELYDHHASLSTNTHASYKLVPSGTELWGEYENGRYIITEVKAQSRAAALGLKAGRQVLAINDVPIDSAVKQLMPICLRKTDPEALSVTFRLLLAGTHSQPPTFTIKFGNSALTIKDEIPANEQPGESLWIESKILEGNIGYIKINNRLWDNALIPVFDSVLQTLKGTVSLILDLRETPSGGNTTVARAILGSFIPRESYYQKHELTGEERAYGVRRSWMEIVTPRTYVYTKPMVLLANHWTGSVGEGITIGFHANKRATIIGTPLARLNGAIYSYRLPTTNIGFVIPAEKLFHVNGMPREEFVPDVLVDVTKMGNGMDLFIDRAIQVLKKKK